MGNESWCDRCRMVHNERRVGHAPVTVDELVARIADLEAALREIADHTHKAAQMTMDGYQPSPTRAASELLDIEAIARVALPDTEGPE